MNKIITVLAVLFFSVPAMAEDAKTYIQYDSFRFTINNKDAKTFSKNMRAHIKKYHGEGPYFTRIYNVGYGANMDEYIWIMGPTSFAEMDARPEDKGHAADWSDNINPYITSYKNSEIWRGMEGLVIDNTDKKETKKSEKILTRYLTVSPGQTGTKIKDLLKQIKDTLVKTGKVKYWAVMHNLFIQGNLNGRHIMSVSPVESWTSLEEDWEFKKHYEALHGEDSYEKFTENYNTVFSNYWEEMLMLNKEMSNM